MGEESNNFDNSLENLTKAVTYVKKIEFHSAFLDGGLLIFREDSCSTILYANKSEFCFKY